MTGLANRISRTSRRCLPALLAGGALFLGPAVALANGAQYTKNGRRVVYIGEGVKNGGWAGFNNDAGRTVTYVGASGSGAGMLHVMNTGGQPVIRLDVDPETNGGAITALGGKLEIQNAKGDEVVMLDVGPRTNGGIIRVRNGAGKTVLLLGTSGRGDGYVEVDGVGVHDYAEVFELATREGVIPGTVMSVTSAGGAIAPSDGPYDERVVGVVSGAGPYQPGMRIGSRGDGSTDLPIATGGQVFVRVSGEAGPILPGDLLVASSASGVAMRAQDRERAFGAVVGKALDVFDGAQAEGLIRMLVMSR